MKKLLLLSFVLFAISNLQAQKKIEKLDDYKASNGITYKVGDEIKLGRGSDTNGRFVYVNMGGWGAAMSGNPEQNWLGAANAGLLVTIKKIKKYNYKRYKGVYFTVGGGNITNYTIDIENAIATCEIENCNQEDNSSTAATDKYDKLAKVKKLFDDGVLTKEEYETEKEKILKQG